MIGSRPVIVLGNGCRDVEPAILRAVMDLRIPILTSWMAVDLVDNWHPSYYGRPGIYGQRLANKVLYNADHIISVGCQWRKQSCHFLIDSIGNRSVWILDGLELGGEAVVGVDGNI